MNDKQIQAHRQRLLALAARLKGDVSELRDVALKGVGGEPSGNLSNVPVHLADLANQTFEQELAIGLLQNGQEVLGAIAAALDRIEAGTYGKCERCGRPIAEERLQALPYASRCIACEQRVEREKGLKYDTESGF